MTARSQKRHLQSVLSLRMTPDEVQRIDEAAAAKGMRRSAFIRSVLLRNVGPRCSLCNDSGRVTYPLTAVVAASGANGYLSGPCPRGCIGPVVYNPDEAVSW